MIDYSFEAGIPKLLESICECVAILHRQGAVVPTSGGIDSATVLKLSAMALGSKNVKALFLPDASSSLESEQFATEAAEAAGCEFITQDISEAVNALTYNKSNDIVRNYFPNFDEQNEGYSLELNLPDSLRLGTPCYDLAFGRRYGDPERRKRIGSSDLRALIANQNVKQRIRMVATYRLAEALHLAVGGTSNRDERELGFAVKYGDEASDYYPIIGLEKCEVVRLATVIDVPASIIRRTPTTDTFSLNQTQQKYYFGLSASFMRSVISETENDEQIKQACASEGLKHASPDGVRSLVRLLSGAANYNSTRYIFDPEDGWILKKVEIYG
jgi:NAD+ synthase